MTGQARSAASLSGRGDGLTMIRSPPTAIVSEPAVARTCSRLSARAASLCASRQALSRLSACRRSRAITESWLCSGDARNEAVSSAPRSLDIDQHPASDKDGERPGTQQQCRLCGAKEIEIDVRHAGNDFDEDERGN